MQSLKRRYSPELLKQKGITAVGIEKDESNNLVLAIHLDNFESKDLNLPEELQKYPIKYVQSGVFEKFTVK